MEKIHQVYQIAASATGISQNREHWRHSAIANPHGRSTRTHLLCDSRKARRRRTDSNFGLSTDVYAAYSLQSAKLSLCIQSPRRLLWRGRRLVRYRPIILYSPWIPTHTMKFQSTSPIHVASCLKSQYPNICKHLYWWARKVLGSRWLGPTPMSLNTDVAWTREVLWTSSPAIGFSSIS